MDNNLNSKGTGSLNLIEYKELRYLTPIKLDEKDNSIGI